MVTLFIATIVGSVLLTWALVDIYFYSMVFESIRKKGDKWRDRKTFIGRAFFYMLGCEFCFSHWVALGVTPVVCFLTYKLLAGNLWCTVALALIAIPVVAKLALYLRDHSFPPVVNAYDDANQLEITQDNKNEETHETHEENQ
jgi:hypothetical protein